MSLCLRTSQNQYYYSVLITLQFKEFNKRADNFILNLYNHKPTLTK